MGTLGRIMWQDKKGNMSWTRGRVVGGWGVMVYCAVVSRGRGHKEDTYDDKRLQCGM